MPTPKLTYHASITEDGKIVMHDSIRAKMAKEIGHSHKGHDITLTADRKRKTRSNRQNKYYWEVVIPLLVEGFIDQGNELQIGNSEHGLMVHSLMKDNHLDNGIDVVDAQGTVHRLPPSTTRCNTKQFMEYVERIQKWAAEMLNIDIPDPNEQRELSL